MSENDFFQYIFLTFWWIDATKLYNTSSKQIKNYLLIYSAELEIPARNYAIILPTTQLLTIFNHMSVPSVY